MFVQRWHDFLSDGIEMVLVTGANGLVGSHLTEVLLAQGYRVRCMVRPTSDLTYIGDLPVEWAFADVLDGESLRPACEGVDAVCHCAALTRALDEETFLAVNAQGTEALAQACLEAAPGMRRFLQVSSQTAAGPSLGPGDYVDESRSPQPITWYANSKLAAERALLSRDGRLPVTIVRSAAVFGPRDRDFFAYFDLVKHGLNLQLGRQERVYSLIYVRDLAELILLALESEAAQGQTYFACSYAYSYTELSEVIVRAMGKRTLRITLPEAVLTPISLWSRVQGWLTGKPALLNEQRVLDMREHYWLCSGDKARQELGFVPQYDLETAVRETADWYRKNGWL
jgi:nucleoside-diphosphate-sugar epimerase